MVNCIWVLYLKTLNSGLKLKVVKFLNALVYENVLLEFVISLGKAVLLLSNIDPVAHYRKASILLEHNPATATGPHVEFFKISYTGFITSFSTFFTK